MTEAHTGRRAKITWKRTGNYIEAIIGNAVIARIIQIDQGSPEYRFRIERYNNRGWCIHGYRPVLKDAKALIEAKRNTWAKGYI